MNLFVNISFVQIESAGDVGISGIGLKNKLTGIAGKEIIIDNGRAIANIVRSFFRG